MSLFGQNKGLASGGLFAQSQPAQSAPTVQQAANPFGQTLGAAQQRAGLGNSIMGQPQQVAQMPALSQSQAQLSSSLWQPGKEAPRK